MAADQRGLLISRRQFVLGGGGAGLALLAGCQWAPITSEPRRARIPVVGIIWPPVRGPTVPGMTPFEQGLRELGYVEGENIAIERRYGEGQRERLPGLVADLVDRNVDIIVAVGAAILPAKNGTSTIPIVMVNVEDPVGQGVIASLAHPGGNVTGSTHLQTELVGKRVELLKDVAPTISRVGVVSDGSGGGDDRTDVSTAANTLGIRVRPVRVQSAGDVDSAIEEATRRGVDSLLVYGYPATLSARYRIVHAAAQHNLPAIYDRRDFVADGGLMAYGANDAASFRRAAYYIDRILKGAKPADLPVEQPTTFDCVINLQTAQALGLTVPQHVLLQATEVIQ